ncbi:ThuA domain-containing protein [Humisphaera borealis]|uniref:ThuA domain-containing protein n=1 Tax=Humisphaera borealis TaxID=2807512 RepID=A0A7M2WRM0_9BACT|nr:ThuA domain-containing protein [Humisphaera borealis]QOV88195.1 ThuA domain-containing protein [Humisphaera borealis]
MSQLNRRDVLKFAGLFAGGALLSPLADRLAQAADGPKKRILFFTKSSGFQHSAITRPADAPTKLAFAEQYLTDIGAKHGFEVVCSKDGTMFTPENIAKFDAFAFYTTGDLTKDSDKYASVPKKGPDGKALKDDKGKAIVEKGALLWKEPGMGDAGKAAFLEAIKQGKGFMAFHSATDTFHSAKHQKGELIRDVDDKGQDAFDPYIQMIGGEFIVHGAQQKSLLKAVDPKFPGAKAYDNADFSEEWYSLKNFAPDLHVILVQDPAKMTGPMYQRKPFPETWARMHGKGRVFYTSMGHREDVWQRPEFEGLVVGAMQWITGQIEVDVTPNIKQVTPDADAKQFAAGK